MSAYQNMFFDDTDTTDVNVFLFYFDDVIAVEVPTENRGRKLLRLLRGKALGHFFTLFTDNGVTSNDVRDFDKGYEIPC